MLKIQCHRFVRILYMCSSIPQKHEIKGPEQSQVKLSGNISEVRNIDRDKELEKLKGWIVCCFFPATHALHATAHLSTQR